MLKYEHTGDTNSKNLLIFLHGFPDSIRLWDGTILSYININRHYSRIEGVKCLILNYYISKLSSWRIFKIWNRFP